MLPAYRARTGPSCRFRCRAAEPEAPKRNAVDSIRSAKRRRGRARSMNLRNRFWMKCLTSPAPNKSIRIRLDRRSRVFRRGADRRPQIFGRGRDRQQSAGKDQQRNGASQAPHKLNSRHPAPPKNRRFERYDPTLSITSPGGRRPQPTSTIAKRSCSPLCNDNSTRSRQTGRPVS
jgi:hypothetical protein